MSRHPRRVPTRAELLQRMPRALRPRLDAAQQRDLDMLHHLQLDDIAHGRGTADTLWEWVASILTWSQAATLAQIGEHEMHAQLLLAEAVIQRWHSSGRVGFSGPEYQLARDGVQAMTLLAQTVDRATATQAANWSEHQLSLLRTTRDAPRAALPQPTDHPTSPATP